MSIVNDLLVGKSEKTQSSGNQFQRSTPVINPRLRMPFDLLTRAIVGQMAAPPETAISVPQQQAVSNLQAGLPALMANFGIGSSAVERLGGRPITPVATSMGAATPGAMLPGPQQFGRQSREQLGLPPRASYLGPFMPSAEDIAAIGIPPVRGGSKRLQKLSTRENKLEARVERREAAGKGTKQAERKLERVRRKKDAASEDY